MTQDKGVPASPSGSQASPEAASCTASSPSVSIPNAVSEALLEIVGAVREYLPPDGINKDQLIHRVIGAVDNPRINPIIAEIENGRS